MESEKTTPLANLAKSVEDAATELAQVVQASITASSSVHEKLELAHTQLRCFSDVCHHLSVQLSDSGDLVALTTTDLSEEFWRSLRLVLKLWLDNIQDAAERLRTDQKQRASWMGKIVLGLGLDDPDEPSFYRANRAAETYLQDAEMIIALLNLETEIRRNPDPVGHLGLDFLVHDLERKAAMVRARVDCTRRKLKPDPSWGETHLFIVQTFMDTALRVKKIWGLE